MSSDEEWRQESLQMWEFMVRLEGFSTARAANCLSKLFHAHYDTMSVLKLVTKQDLVVDAGLKPGDALRIVVAAKDYKPPHSGKPKRPPKRPVESIALTESSEPATKEIEKSLLCRSEISQEKEEGERHTNNVGRVKVDERTLEGWTISKRRRHSNGEQLPPIPEATVCDD